MTVLSRLQRTLSNLNRVALARLRPGDAVQMLNERAKLEEWIGGTAKIEDSRSGTIEEALSAYRENNYLKGLRQIRLVCYGCTQVLDGGYRLIDNREPFEQLLLYAERYGNRPASLRKLYRGLLNCYFAYDPHASNATPSGRSNWEKLRAFLSRHLALLGTRGYTPDWIAALNQHSNLLGTDPCRPYEQLVFEGDWSIFDELRERLEIGTDSWLVRQMVMTPIKTVESMDDAEFKDHLDSILLLLHDYRLYADAGLTILLNRYAQCRNRKVSAPLRDFAIARWGNPWLPENSHQWQCSKEASQMLGYWLKRHLLSGFFNRLSNDDKKLSRRLNFWKLYSEDLTGMYFALGRDAFDADDMELYKFRRAAKGLIAKLGEDRHDVHACIMQFAHHHVVEFNRDNNVAYLYDLKQGTPQFYLSKGWAEIGALSVTSVNQGVDVSRQSIPLRHQDTPQLSWEGRFAQELGATPNAIRAFCRNYQCHYTDNRNQDGREWIRPENLAKYGPEVWSILSGWGFCLSSEENGYFRLSNMDIAL
ncbi:MAG TPA: EH signature domain-containing protein [Gallionella sp.]|nr:EH signature domain-containing protein [Gallionella sp.]